jgi:hypothetical protein
MHRPFLVALAALALATGWSQRAHAEACAA